MNSMTLQEALDWAYSRNQRIAELEVAYDSLRYRHNDAVIDLDKAQAEIEGHELMAEKNADRIAELVGEVFALSAQLEAEKERLLEDEG